MLCQTLSEIDDASWLSPDFIKACIRVVMCCIRLGDMAAGREAVQIIVRYSTVPRYPTVPVLIQYRYLPTFISIR